MANSHDYTGPGTRWSEEDPTAEDYLNVSRINNDHLHEALNVIMDTDAADFLKAITIKGNVTVGADDLGFDVKFFGDTAGKYMLWDTSADKLTIEGDVECTGTATGFAGTDTSFMVAHTAGTANVTGNATTYTMVYVDTGGVLHDTGSNFASNTFTAPVAGRYLFSANVSATGFTSSHSYTQIQIITSDQTYQGTWDGWSTAGGGVAGVERTGFREGLTLIADMDASDTAYVTFFVYGGAQVVDLTGTILANNFSGALMK